MKSLRHPGPTRHSRGILIPATFAAALMFLLAGEPLRLIPPATAGVPAETAEEETPSDDNPDQPADPPSDTEPEEEELPKIADMQLPTAAELLARTRDEQRRDWVVLTNEDVIVAQPIYPRPNTLEKMQQAIDESVKWPRPATPEERDEQRARREALYYVDIALPGEDDLFQLHRRHISEVIHHEDLMLRRIGKLLDENDENAVRDAFEMIFVLKRSNPQWPGLIEQERRILFLEAQNLFGQQRPEAALPYLEDLHSRVPKYSGLQSLLGEVIDALITQAVEEEDFRRGRHFLRRLTAMEPQHAVARKWESDLKSRAAKLIESALSASGEGQHDVALRDIERAARVWPETPGLRDAHRRLSDRFQQLRVGVVQLPGEPSPWFLGTRADRREQYLVRPRLFEVDRISETTHYTTRFFSNWEPTDLGRRAIFRLKQNRSPSESLPILTANSLLRSFRPRIEPGSPLFDERLASYVGGLTINSPFEFQVEFDRVPLSIESVLDFPLESTPPRQTGDQPASGPSANAMRFHRHRVDDDEIAWRRVIPEPDDLPEYHLAELIEQRYPSHEKSVQGLLRGEVSAIINVQPPDVDRLREDGRFFILPHAQPITHSLQFNHRSSPLKHRELRRALAHAIDARRILDEEILGESGQAYGRLISAPWASRLNASNPLVRPRPYDLTLAVSLVIAARRQLGGKLPSLKMLCDPDPIARRSAMQVVQAWRKIGVPVTLIPDDAAPSSADSSEWDVLYRTSRMTDPLTDLWPWLTLQDRARVRDLEFLPDWLRQEFIELDRSGDWPTAIAWLHRLHEHLLAEVQVIPLFEVDDHSAIRRNVRGFSLRPVTPYQNIEDWTVRSWYPTDQP